MFQRSVAFIIMFLIMFCNCSPLQLGNSVEPRGKKKKIALFVYFADLLVKKFFILKLIYAFVLWCVIHKAGYFLGWFISFLKEKKQVYHAPHYHYPDHDSHYAGHDSHYPGHDSHYAGHDSHYHGYPAQGSFYEHQPYGGYGPPDYYGSGPYKKKSVSR